MAREILTWIDSRGAEYNLSGLENIDISISPQGRFMPPIDLVEQEVPFQSGSRLKQVNVKAREIDLPLEISCTSTSELRTKLREILNMFNPLKGDGTLKTVNEDGTQRYINCRYKSGLEIQESGMPWQRAVIVLKAFDPYWYDSIDNVLTFKLNDFPGLFFPILPLRLVSSTVFADITINNTGDVETWPEWIITGPGENIVLTNMTTGEITNLNVSLDVGETLTIETKPFVKTITKNDGTNLFYTMSDDSSLWALQDGNNSIQIEMSNATTDSNIQLTYNNRYWGP